jgi:serine/threonine protein kinase
MQVLKLCQYFCPSKISHFQIGEKLGEGVDGEVFALQDISDQVIKLSIIYSVDELPVSIYHNRVVPTLYYVMQTQPDVCVRVDRFGKLGQIDQLSLFLYYCLMERLLPLSEDEGKVFYSLLSHEDRGIEKDLSPAKIEKTLSGLARGLDFDRQMVTLFCQQLRQEMVLRHRDLEVRNIMKDAMGHFKLIDLDRSTLEV